MQLPLAWRLYGELGFQQRQGSRQYGPRTSEGLRCRTLGRDRHDDQSITCSPFIHVTFEVGKATVDTGSLPGLIRGRDVVAPLGEMQQDLGGAVTGVFQMASRKTTG